MRLKNQFRSLDEDEVEFLDSILESTRAQEAAVKKDTADHLEAFRKQREEAEKAMLGSTSSEVAPTEEEEWTIPARKRRRDKGKDLLLPGKKRKASTTESNVDPETSKEETLQKDGPKAASSKETSGASVAFSAENAQSTKMAENATKDASKSGTIDNIIADSEQPTKPVPASLGLVGYGSDSDSE